MVIGKRVQRFSILIEMVYNNLFCIVSGVSNAQNLSIGMPSSIAPIFMKFWFFKGYIFRYGSCTVCIFICWFIWYSTGTLVGVASKADMLDEKGNLPKARQALFADSLGTTVKTMLGTSTVTTFVESASEHCRRKDRTYRYCWLYFFYLHWYLNRYFLLF